MPWPELMSCPRGWWPPRAIRSGRLTRPGLRAEAETRIQRFGFELATSSVQVVPEDESRLGAERQLIWRALPGHDHAARPVKLCPAGRDRGEQSVLRSHELPRHVMERTKFTVACNRGEQPGPFSGRLPLTFGCRCHGCWGCLWSAL